MSYLSCQANIHGLKLLRLDVILGQFWYHLYLHLLLGIIKLLVVVIVQFMIPNLQQYTYMYTFMKHIYGKRNTVQLTSLGCNIPVRTCASSGDSGHT